MNQFDTKDRSLSKKQDKQQQDKNEVVTAIVACKGKLSAAQVEAEVRVKVIKKWIKLCQFLVTTSTQGKVRA